jgi:hypothetical protein
VHAELSRSDNLLPVSEVALKWGFTPMGRFAAQYRAARQARAGAASGLNR